MKKRLFRSKKRVIRNSLVIANVALLIGVAAFVFASRPTASPVGSPLLSSSTNDEIADPLDALSSVDIALNISLLADLPQAAAVVHDVDAENQKSGLVASDAQVIAKPQIVTTEVKTLQDLITYVVVEGDTISSVAENFNISADSVRWSNGLSGDTLREGTEINIPPIDGVVHEVTAQDTVADIAEEYNAEASRIIAFNDIELTGLVEGTNIVVPEGRIKPRPVFTNYAFVASFNGNRYAPGNCTWHTANRRAAVGKPLPGNLGNAASWVYRSSSAGIATGSVPAQHAVIQTSSTGYGHVGFVEEVYEDGSILISEMNYNWQLYALRNRVVSAAEAASYRYIY